MHWINYWNVIYTLLLVDPVCMLQTITEKCVLTCSLVLGEINGINYRYNLEPMHTATGRQTIAYLSYNPLYTLITYKGRYSHFIFVLLNKDPLLNNSRCITLLYDSCA